MGRPKDVSCNVVAIDIEVWMIKSIHFLFILVQLLTLLACSQNRIKKETVGKQNPWLDVEVYAEEHLPKIGTLIQNSDGYAYIKVDDAYINELFPRLNLVGFQKPPYFRRHNAPGAHISVAYKNEHVALKEIGEQFSFFLKDIEIIHSSNQTSYVIFRIYAPALEALRKRYGLSPKLNNHEFHITLAKRVKK